MLRSYDLEIDLEARTAQRAGRAIRLTGREFALLACLARHLGRVQSSTVIWECLLGDLNQVGTRRLAPLIRALRQKIDKGFPIPLILTARGRGYLLRGDGE